MPSSPVLNRAPVFLDYFKGINDLRQATNALYPFEVIFLLVLCVGLSGVGNWTSIALYGQMKLDLLRRFLPFADGAPCHDQVGILFPDWIWNSFSSALSLGSAPCTGRWRA